MKITASEKFIFAQIAEKSSKKENEHSNRTDKKVYLSQVDTKYFFVYLKKANNTAISQFPFLFFMKVAPS